MKIVLLLLCITLGVALGAYSPTWASLDARPLPTWYDQVKFGIFIHWGVFSVPSYECSDDWSAEWYWYALKGAKVPCVVDWHNKTFGSQFTYQDFAPSFHALFFNATYWADLFYNSGAKYVVLTSKHHEGFCNWPSNVAWNWNSVDVGPHLDLVGTLTKAVKARGLHMGLYHSLFEWFNPLYLADKANNGTTQVYVDTILMPELYDIVNSYQPDVIWSDGDWEMPDSYWKSKEFLAWLYNESPVKNSVVVNDRWGSGDACVHGGYWTCQDRYNPHHLVNHKWENAMTIDGYTWGFARNHDIADYLTIETLIASLASTVAYGGNLLLNVGPTADGMINPIFQEKLLQIGSWLSVNGDAIYATQPWRVQNETDNDLTVYFTYNSPTIYAIVLGSMPESGQMVLTSPIMASQNAVINVLGYGSVAFTRNGGNINITLPRVSGDIYNWAYVLQLIGFK